MSEIKSINDVQKNRQKKQKIRLESDDSVRNWSIATEIGQLRANLDRRVRKLDNSIRN